MGGWQVHATTLAEGLRSREADLCEAILQRVRQFAPDADRDNDPERVAAMRATISAAVGSWLARIERGETGIVGLPAAAWENVRLAARHGLSLSATLQSYLTGHLVSWEYIVEETATLSLDERDRITLLKRVSVLETTYFNELLGLVSEVYLQERERVTRTRDQRRAQLVREVLDGGEVSSSDLDYDLDAHHTSVIVTAAQPYETALALRSLVDRCLLTVSRTEHTMWAWLGGRTPIDDAVLAAALHRLSSDDVQLAIGEPGSGADGFRLTHLQACAAYAVAQQRPATVTRYADVSLTSLGLQADRLGPAFIKLWLGPLDGDPGRGKVLRKTLRAYFASSQNAVSAAAALGVHARTVANRLRAVEQALGEPVNIRRAELETALRLEDLGAGATPHPRSALSPRASSPTTFQHLPKPSSGTSQPGVVSPMQSA
jgi:hypothetical protein